MFWYQELAGVASATLVQENLTSQHPESRQFEKQVLSKCSLKIMQKAPVGAFCIIFKLHLEGTCATKLMYKDCYADVLSEVWLFFATHLHHQFLYKLIMTFVISSLPLIGKANDITRFFGGIVA